MSYVQAGVNVMKLEDKLKSISSLEELEGFANRRKVLHADLPMWSDEERAIILHRKYELEQEKM